MKMLKKELKNLLSNKILLISVIAVAFIPIIYTSVFDKSLWNPFQEIKKMKVAVVNNDKPVTLMGQKIDVGKQVTDQLKKDKVINWQFVTEEQAKKGLKDLDYYSIITLPEDFSESATSVLKSNPKKMEIDYTTNGSYNYLAEEITEGASVELEMKIRNQVVQAYVEAVDKVAKTMMSSLNKASNGAQELTSGSNQLVSGLTTYTNGVSQAANGSGQLTSGVNQLQQGIGPLSNGVNELYGGASQLSSALGDINSKISPIQSNLPQIEVSLNDIINASNELTLSLQNFESHLNPQTQQDLVNQLNVARQKLNELVTNANQLSALSNDASQVSIMANKVSSDISNLNVDVQSASNDINSQISNIINANDSVDEAIKGQLINDITSYVNNRLVVVNNELNLKLASISTNLNELVNIANSVSAKSLEASNIANAMSINANSMHSAINDFENGFNSLNSTLNLVPNSNNSNNIVNQLQYVTNLLNETTTLLPEGLNGINQLASGSSELTNGLGQLQSKIPTLSNGVSELDSGANQLQSGLSELQANSPKLLSGIDQLQAGADELASGLEKGVTESKTVKITNKTIDQFADPVTTNKDSYTKVNNYGEALAPYIMSLALYVGCMLFNFVYPIRKTSMDDGTSKGWWLSKITIGFIVSSLMAIIQVTVMMMLKLPMYNVLLLYLTALVTAWCYMFMVMFLAMTFDDPGRFVAMILLVLQLGGAGGTFPVQLQAQFYQTIHPFLPMSYSIYTLRNAIAGGISKSLLTKSYSVMIILAIVFIILLRISMNRLMKQHKQNVSVRNNNQELLAVESNTKENIQNQIQANIEKEQLENNGKRREDKK